MRWVLIKPRKQGRPVSGFCKVVNKVCPHYSKSKYGDFCGDVTGVNDIEDIIFHSLGCPRINKKKLYKLTKEQERMRVPWQYTG